MEGKNRREKLILLLQQADAPISGTDLAKQLGVSRQVIVQDIALLRAVDKNILSTNKGYVLHVPGPENDRVKRSFAVSHSKEQIQDELYTMVDYGGKVLDVVVEHDIYGQIMVDLILCNRLDVDEFVERIKNSKSRPLKVLTDGEHWHTVEADSEKILDKIEEKLKEKGYLR
ncbi:MAG: transcription repressor NadR [Roseburia sp.]|nr:transcription repressor NadR [Roseburia sp.]